jgi:hypothetical protein
LQPKASLALALPVDAVIEAALRSYFGNRLRIVFRHPAIQVIKERRKGPHIFRMKKMNPERFANP